MSFVNPRIVVNGWFISCLTVDKPFIMHSDFFEEAFNYIAYKGKEYAVHAVLISDI